MEENQPPANMIPFPTDKNSYVLQATVGIGGGVTVHTATFMSVGSLQTVISSHCTDGIPMQFLPKILFQVLLALAHFHVEFRVHGNLKPSNILIDLEGLVKVSDERTSLWFEASEYWMPTEIVGRGRKICYSVEGDIWAFGVTALELARGGPPISVLPSPEQTRTNFTFQERFRFNSADEFRKVKGKDFPLSFKDLVKRCLVSAPSKRPTAKELLKHEFFNGINGQDISDFLSGVPPIQMRHTPLQDRDGDAHIPTSEEWVYGWAFNGVRLEFDPIYEDEDEATDLDDNVW